MAARKSFLADTPAELFITSAPAPERSSAAEYGAPAETKSRRVQLLMQPSLHNKLKAAAQAQGISFNEYVHKALENAVKEQ